MRTHLLQLGPHESALQPGAPRMQGQERRRVVGAHGLVRRERKSGLRTPLQAVRQPAQHACDVHALRVHMCAMNIATGCQSLPHSAVTWRMVDGRQRNFFLRAVGWCSPPVG